MQPTVDVPVESLEDTARHGSGLATVYHALDQVVAHYELRDAAVVVDVPGLGRQVLHAGRRPLHNDERRLHEAEPGLYLDPPVHDAMLSELMLAVGTLALRYDTRDSTESGQMSLDELELGLRRLPGVLAVGFAETEGLVIVEVQAGPDACDELARDATVLATEHLGDTVAVEIVRWGDGPPRPGDARLRLLDVTTDTAAGEIAVHLARGDDRAVGRASTAHALLGVVEATVYAIRTFLPDLSYLPGWARTVETTPDRRFLVVASVTDPEARSHLRGAAEGRSPLDAAARATLAALNRTISREL